ncbi:MAG TPA: glycosyltransferase family 39 protein [Candidatus Paceibacterota bacterium]
MKVKHWLLLILGLAFLLRIAGINYGLPLQLVGDEPSPLYGSLQMLETRTLIPGLHPSEFLQKLYFPPYLSYIYIIPVTIVLGLWYLVSGVSFETFKNLVMLDPTALFLTIRLLSAAAGTLAVYFVYKAGRNIFKEERAALLSGAVMALAYLPVNFSHWGRHWSFVTLVFSLVIWTLSRTDLSTKGRYLWSTVLVGFGFGINYQAGIATIFIISWYLLADKYSIVEALKSKWFWQVVLTFCVLIGTVIALYPQNLQVIAPISVARYSADEPTGLFGFIWSYYFYFKLLLLTEPTLLIAMVVGLLVGLKSKIIRRYFLTSAIFAILYVAIFYFAFHLQGRYILMLYPLFAIIGGYGLSRMNKNIAYVLLGVMLVISLRFDQLLIKNDTRIQTRQWIFENVESGSKVVVLARLTRLPNIPEAISEQALIDPGSLRKVDEAERSLPPQYLPDLHYHALNLGTVSNGELFTNLNRYLVENKYDYAVISPEFAIGHDLPSSCCGSIVKSFPGYDTLDDINDLTNGFGGGLPFLFSGRSNGPTINMMRL